MMEAADVAALAHLVAPRLRRVGLLCPAYEANARYHWPSTGGFFLGAGSTAAVTALAMGLPRPVDAAGRPAGLELFLGVEPVGGGAGELERALAGAGRGWVRVVWANL
jgi:hypothetical protein